MSYRKNLSAVLGLGVIFFGVSVHAQEAVNSDSSSSASSAVSAPAESGAAVAPAPPMAPAATSATSVAPPPPPPPPPMPPPPSAFVASSPPPIPIATPPAKRWRSKSLRKGELGFGGAYSMSLGLGRTHDFAGDYSGRGFNLQLRYFVHEQVSIGVLSGWNLLDDKLRETVLAADDNIAFTATQLRFFEAVPLLATTHYHFELSNDCWIPFVGLGMGAYWSRRQVDTGFLSRKDADWHFGLAPELGMLIAVGKMFVMLDTRLNFPVQASRADNELFMTFNIGLFGF